MKVLLVSFKGFIELQTMLNLLIIEIKVFTTDITTTLSFVIRLYMMTICYYIKVLMVDILWRCSFSITINFDLKCILNKSRVNDRHKIKTVLADISCFLNQLCIVLLFHSNDFVTYSFIPAKNDFNVSNLSLKVIQGYQR